MQIVNSGDTYEIYRNSLRTYDKLPAQVYKVCFHEQKGFWLEEHMGIEVNETKTYGVHEQKVQKVLNNFTLFNRNLGVILSGDKGIGKSLFSRMLSIAAIKQGIPVIIVDGYIPGIASYLEEIEQEVMILFDEFDKTFDDKKGSAQTSMLSLFDGISPGKKLFVVTCNSLYKLNEYLVNRPGRFHYHLRFDYPGRLEIEEYLKDKLEEEYWDEIHKVVRFSMKVRLNYDCLRAIAFELNQGLSFEEAVADLNIIRMEDAKYKLKLVLSNGKVCNKEEYLDIFDDEEKRIWCSTKGHSFYLHFTPSESEYDTKLGGEVIWGKDLKIDIDLDNYYTETDEEKALLEEAKTLKPECLILKRVFDKNIHYAV